MINSFEIENFRLFDKLKINRFGRVNLIVGKNNVGKSAILEALILFFSKGSIREVKNIIISRQEDWVPSLNNNSDDFLCHPIRHLFKGHKLPDIEGKGIKLLSNDKNAALEIKAAFFVLDERDFDYIHRRIAIDDITNADIDNLRLFIVSEYAGKTMARFSIEDGLFSSSKHQISITQVKVATLPYQFVPTQGVLNKNISSIWDSISLTDLEKEVVNGLRILEPSVTAIAFVGDESGRPEKRIPLIKMDDYEEPVPLKSLGDGISRIFQIILSLVNAKNGALLIDEFENGLHWSVQEKVWKMVFELSERLNVQVFATTHSRDCVNNFQKVWETDENAGAFIRLSKKGEKIVTTEYDLELLSDSVETDVEVR